MIMSNIDCQNTYLYLFVDIGFVSFNTLFKFILFFPIFNKAIPNLYQFFYIIIPIILVKHFYFIGIFKINEDPILILISTSKTPSIRCAKFRAIYKPNIDPPVVLFLDSSSLYVLSKIQFKCSLAIPVPSSDTVITRIFPAS